MTWPLSTPGTQVVLLWPQDCVCVGGGVYVCVFVCGGVCVCGGGDVCVWGCMCVYMRMCVCVYVYVYMHMCVCVCGKNRTVISQATQGVQCTYLREGIPHSSMLLQVSRNFSDTTM